MDYSNSNSLEQKKWIRTFSDKNLYPRSLHGRLYGQQTSLDSDQHVLHMGGYFQNFRMTALPSSQMSTSQGLQSTSHGIFKALHPFLPPCYSNLLSSQKNYFPQTQQTPLCNPEQYVCMPVLIDLPLYPNG